MPSFVLLTYTHICHLFSASSCYVTILFIIFLIFFFYILSLFTFLSIVIRVGHIIILFMQCSLDLMLMNCVFYLSFIPSKNKNVLLLLSKIYLHICSFLLFYDFILTQNFYIRNTQFKMDSQKQKKQSKGHYSPSHECLAYTFLQCQRVKHKFP